MKLLSTFPQDDVLTELLWSVRVRSTLYCRSELTAPWGFGVAARPVASFHLMTGGDGWLEVQSIAQPIHLASGDLVILPQGHAHQVRSDLRCRVTRLEDLLASHHKADDGRQLHYGGGGARTDLLCGGFAIEDQGSYSVLAALPPVIHLRGSAQQPDTWLEALVHLLQEEMAAWSPGAEAVVTRLTDALLTQAIRRYYLGRDGFSAPQLSALRDPQVAAAMRLIHEQPEEAWTASSLAAQVAMSRSAFSTRFRAITGESPIRYLTRYRLAQAANRLRASSASLLEIALQTGYASDVALSKAFKRHFGVAPGSYRKRAR